MIPSFLFPAFVSLPVHKLGYCSTDLPQTRLPIHTTSELWGVLMTLSLSMGPHTPSLDHHSWGFLMSLSLSMRPTPLLGTIIPKNPWSLTLLLARVQGGENRQRSNDWNLWSLHAWIHSPLNFCKPSLNPITCRTEPPVLKMVLSTCYSPLSLLPSLILRQSLSSTQQPRLGKANAPGMVVPTPSSSLHDTNGSLIMGIFSSLPRILL